MPTSLQKAFFWHSLPVPMALAHLLAAPASHLSCQPISSSFLKIFSWVASRAPSLPYPRLTFLSLHPHSSFSLSASSSHLFALDLRQWPGSGSLCPAAQCPSLPSPALFHPNPFCPLTLCCWRWPSARGTCLALSVSLSWLPVAPERVCIPHYDFQGSA